MTSLSPPSRDTSQLLPREAREEFRKNNLTHISCSQFCDGYLQSNIACLPSNMADDFERLCINNSSPFPLLYRSQPGEISVPPLASNSDVRTDLPLYAVSENGIVTRHVSDVSDIPWEGMVTFYFGCSFSFEFMLKAAQVPMRHLIDKHEVPVYVIKIPLLPQGPFSGHMVVTMRTIPRKFVQKATDVCVPLEFAHGAPIHIGAPSIIGIEDLQHPAFGDEPTVGENDVLVFWGCGISATEAITSAKPQIAVSLSPRCVGSLFITDHKVMDYYNDHPPNHAQLSPKVIFLSESPQFASLVSREVIDQIVRKENELKPHKHGESTNGCKERGDYLLKSAMALSHASSVAIVTCSPKETSMQVSERQFAAAICIAKALLAQGKEITVLAAEGNAIEWEMFFAKCEAEKILSKCIPIMSVAITVNDWSRDVRSVMHKVVDYLGPSFRSSSLSSVIVIDEQGNLFIQSLLCLGENLKDGMTSNIDHVIENNRPIENDCWLSPRVVAMASYVLNTCPIHCRYVRRGRGKHVVKAENEFLVTPKQMESLRFGALDDDKRFIQLE